MSEKLLNDGDIKNDNEQLIFDPYNPNNNKVSHIFLCNILVNLKKYTI